MINTCPSIHDFRQAAERIEALIHHTPVVTNSGFNQLTGAQVFFKCENFQKVGAFKFRGACNAVFSLSEVEAARGVATHSSGNHAQALSLAARLRGTKAHIVMPTTSPGVKQAAVRSYGGIITFCEPTLAARESTLDEVIKETGAVVIHPYNDYRIITGQGTAALELLEEAPELDIIMTPVGGGGLLSGTALAAAGISPSTKVIAGEPENADDAYRSLVEGKIIPSNDPQTVADGLRTSLGTLTFPIIRDHVSAIVTVSEEAIIRAMRYVWERMKIVIEPSSAVPVAALMEGKVESAGKRIGVILSGGNVDLDKLPWMRNS